MADDDSGLFGGSVDRSRLEEMKAAAGDDPDRQARVAEVQAQVDAVDESDAAAEDARQQAAGETADEAEAEQPEQPAQESETAATEPAPEPAEDLSSLSKAELRDRVVAQRVQYGHDETQARGDVEAENKTKAELAAELGG